MKTRSSQNYPLEGQNKYWIATIDKKTNKGRNINPPKKQPTNQPNYKHHHHPPPAPACAHGIKKHIMHVYAQGQGIEANMQSQVQNFLATAKQFKYTLIVLCVILTY